MMIPPPHKFEGVFITQEKEGPVGENDYVAFKYKTCLYEEQPRWAVNETLVSPQNKAIIPLLREVYSTKTKKPIVEKEKKSKPTLYCAKDIAT